MISYEQNQKPIFTECSDPSPPKKIQRVLDLTRALVYRALVTKISSKYVVYYDYWFNFIFEFIDMKIDEL